jgi:hypothetical protein
VHLVPRIEHIKSDMKKIDNISLDGKNSPIIDSLKEIFQSTKDTAEFENHKITNCKLSSLFICLDGNRISILTWSLASCPENNCLYEGIGFD